MQEHIKSINKTASPPVRFIIPIEMNIYIEFIIVNVYFMNTHYHSKGTNKRHEKMHE